MQTVPDKFHAASQGPIVPIDYGLRVSFTKNYDNTLRFFKLNESMLNGTDLLASSDDNPLQAWDKYDYANYTDRVIALEWTREIGFPYSVQSAMADITINNYDDCFTPNSSSPLESYIIPARPLRIFGGYKNASVVQQFVGLSQDMPEIDEQSKTASFHALDFLSEIFTMDISDTVAMQDVTTDVVLANIFQQFGLSPSQYSLAKGRNKIPFLYFEPGLNAGNVMQQLMQAEMGQLWLDEQGIIRFDERLKSEQTPVKTFDESNIIGIRVLDKDNIINTIKITSSIRQVQDFQPIYTTAYAVADSFIIDDNSFVVPAGGSAFYPNATLSDPALSATLPTIGQKNDTSWFTALNLDGSEVLSGVSVTLGKLNQASYTMLFENTNAFPVVIDQVEVWGQPAKVVDTINYKAFDDTSVTKYGVKLLEIENDFFGNLGNCESFAKFVLNTYSEYGGVIEMEVKGDLAQQLGDIITVDKDSYTGTYKISKTSNRLASNTAEQTIQAERYIPRSWFILNQSTLNSASVLAP